MTTSELLATAARTTPGLLPSERDRLMEMSKVDHCDVFELAGEIAESIEPADGSGGYEGDDLPGDCIIPHLIPVFRELADLKDQLKAFQSGRELAVRADVAYRSPN